MGCSPYKTKGFCILFCRASNPLDMLPSRYSVPGHRRISLQRHHNEGKGEEGRLEWLVLFLVLPISRLRPDGKYRHRRSVDEIHILQYDHIRSVYFPAYNPQRRFLAVIIQRACHHSFLPYRILRPLQMRKVRAVRRVCCRKRFRVPGQ